MANPTPRVRMPTTVKAGEVFEIKTLIAHEMETGLRKEADGKVVPRKIIKSFVAKFNGKEILRSDWHPAISANPYLGFSARVSKAGTFQFEWTDDDGSVYKAEQAVTIG